MTGGNKQDILVAAIGNPDRGDDGVGPAIAARLRGKVSKGVRILLTGGDVLALIDEWDAFQKVIVIDAAAPLDRPGRIHRLDIGNGPLSGHFARSSSHAFGLGELVELARNLGRLPCRLVAYLVEGERFDIGAPLSPAVAEAVDTVTQRVIDELLMMRGHNGKRGAQHA